MTLVAFGLMSQVMMNFTGWKSFWHILIAVACHPFCLVIPALDALHVSPAGIAYLLSVSDLTQCSQGIGIFCSNSVW